jgi:hypothetical protein
VHEIDPSVVSELGLHIESRYCLARGTDGRPYLWLRRRRVPRALGTGPRLAFDPLTADFGGRPRSASTSFTVDLSASTPTVRDGLPRADATVTVTNEGSATIGPLVLYFEAQSGALDLPVHAPVTVGPIAPSSTATTTLEVGLLRDPAVEEPFVLRALVTEPQRFGAIAKLATTPVDVDPLIAPPGLRVERAGSVVADGPLRRVPLAIHVDAGVDFETLQIDVQSGAGGAPAPAVWTSATTETSSVSGSVTLNATTIEPPVSLRARVETAAGEVLVSNLVAIDDINVGEGMASILDVRFELRDARRRVASIEALGVITVANAGEREIDDLELTFEQGLPRSSSWRWTPIAHRRRDTTRIVGAASSWATPILLTLQPMDPAIAFLRVWARSAVSGVARMVLVVEGLALGA